MAALSAPGAGAGKRALVTGVSGFTGVYVVNALKQAGYRVFGTVRADQPAGIDQFAVDLADAAAVGAVVAQVQPDVVVHLAAISFVAHADVDVIYRVNIGATRNLLAALAAAPHRCSKVVLASSANIYGNADVGLITESQAPAPANDYAVSKLAMEYMARLWMDRLPIVIVRPFNYTGVGQDARFLLAKMVDHVRRRAPAIELGQLAIARDFSDVRTVATCYQRLLETGQPGQVYNICSGQSVSLQGALDLLADIAGYRIAVSVNPAFVRANDVLTLAGSNAKLIEAIGPIDAVPLATTLRWMVEA
ncbi:NAD-dependent epimerase/dehydratase family protein [Massilia sp. DWR3-1-1]|uniref:NAD-dependent epimerase/dehydratase family protein n=1 Tax=Massilia sp. DWR3-1-1 TaxID=2804559 RepID=UPI003CED1E3D